MKPNLFFGQGITLFFFCSTAACDCSEFGAMRDDCEQMSGRCDCKDGVVGGKCETCAGGGFLGALGCSSLRKNHHDDATESVPIYAWTGIDYTEPGDEAGNLDVRSSRGTTFPGGFKSTRHLQQPPGQRPTPVTFQVKIKRIGLLNLIPHLIPKFNCSELSLNWVGIYCMQIKSYLGDSCLSSVECLTPHSLCVSGWCACADGFHQDSELIQCLPICKVKESIPGFDLISV